MSSDLSERLARAAEIGTPTARRLADDARVEIDRMTRERDALAGWQVYGSDAGWYIRGLWCLDQPFPTREAAAGRLVKYVLAIADTPAAPVPATAPGDSRPYVAREWTARQWSDSRLTDTLPPSDGGGGVRTGDPELRFAASTALALLLAKGGGS